MLLGSKTVQPLLTKRADIGVSRAQVIREARRFLGGVSETDWARMIGGSSSMFS